MRSGNTGGGGGHSLSGHLLRPHCAPGTVTAQSDSHTAMKVPSGGLMAAPKRRVRVLIPGSYHRDLIWKQGLCRCN